MADENTPGSEGSRREGIKILPGEWRRRLAERQARDTAPIPPSPPAAPPAPAADSVGAAADRAREALSAELERLRVGIGAPAPGRPDPAPPEPAPPETVDPAARPAAELSPQGSREGAKPDRERSDFEHGVEERLAARLRSEIETSLQQRLDAALAKTVRQVEQQAQAAEEEMRERLLAKVDVLRISPPEQERVTAEARRAARSEAKKRGRKIQRKVKRSVDAINKEHSENLARSVGQQAQAAEEEQRERLHLKAEETRAHLAAEVEQARAALVAEAESAREAISREAEQTVKSLAEQQRQAAEDLSAKSIRRDRRMARDERARTTKKLLEAGESAERASIEAQRRISDGAEQAIAEFRAEGERQSAEATRQVRAARESLSEAVDKSRSVAQRKMREDLERMLDDLLRDIRGIGEQRDEG